MQHIFIVGAKSLGTYGGYETFVNKLTEYHQNHTQLKYHIACKANGYGSMDEMTLEGVEYLSTTEFEYHGAHCFKIKVPNIGSAQAIYYDVTALRTFCRYIKRNNIENPIIYILACRIGPFAAYFQRKIHRLGGNVYINPDGHEWKRAKWSLLVKKYWKISSLMMIKHADLIICDSQNIEKYVHDCYEKYKPNTKFIAYGAETRKSILEEADSKLLAWYKENEVQKKGYYLMVGRFVPENNYETIIREYMKSHTKRELVIITNENKNFLDKLEVSLHFKKDPRIKFVGTVYNQELLKKIRENAYGYFHGHEVGGTNPSLLEAMASTELNLIFDVEFNREVAEDTVLYWNKKLGNLAELIEFADKMSEVERKKIGERAKKRISEAYSWQYIVGEYEQLFLKY